MRRGRLPRCDERRVVNCLVRARIAECNPLPNAASDILDPRMTLSPATLGPYAIVSQLGGGLLAVLLVGALPAQAQDVPQLTVGRLTGENRPAIDGLVDDAVWSIVEPYSTFTQQEPTDGQPATEQTDLLGPHRSESPLRRGRLS